MADNVGFTPGTGALIAADEIAGVLHQRAKIQFGADGSATDVSSTDPLPVEVSNFPSPGLTDDQLRAAPVPVSGVFWQGTQPVSGTFWQATQPVSGTVTVANPTATGLTDTQLRASAVPVSGTFYQATQPVSVASLPLPAGAATEATAVLTIKQKNSAATIADYGQVILAQRRDSDTAETTGDGQYTALKQDEAGRLKVATQPASNPAVTGNITSNSGATSIVSIPCGRFGNLSFSMVATTLVGHNATFECSNNSTNGIDGNWYGAQAVRSNANLVDTATGVFAATPAYMWHVNVGDYLYFRVRATAHTSGTAAYILKPGSCATEPIPAVQITGTQPVNGTVAIGAGTARVGFAAGAGIWYDDSAVALAAAASFTGTARDLTVTATATAMANAATYAKELRVSAESDQTGTLWLEVSRDNTNWRRVKSIATAAVTGGGQFAEIIHRPSWRYARVGFTNGATLQTRFSIGSMAIAL